MYSLATYFNSRERRVSLSTLALLPNTENLPDFLNH